ncbi:MAG: hypothetical protein ACHQUC_04075 [Chlamydiales bacterium]
MATPAVGPSCSDLGYLCMLCMRSTYGSNHVLQSVCSKTVQDIFQELGEQCRDKKLMLLAITTDEGLSKEQILLATTTGGDRVLRLNDETKNMSFHEAHRIYLQLDQAQQGNYILITHPL